MRIKSFLSKAVITLSAVIFLYGCASSGNPSQPAEQSGDVQDIAPGDKSIIQPPNSGAPASRPEIQEKSL